HLVNGHLIIRSFQPDAASMTVVLGDHRTPMAQVHPAGVFEAVLSDVRKTVPYKLEVAYYDGQKLLYEDPYAFPPTLSEFDSHLMAEGTHLHIYERLGAHFIELNGVRGVLFAVWAPNAMRVSVVGN